MYGLCLQTCLAPTFPQISYSQPHLESACSFICFDSESVQEKVLQLNSPVYLCDDGAVTLLLPMQWGLLTGTWQAHTDSCSYSFLGNSFFLKCSSKWTVPGSQGEQWEVCHSFGHSVLGVCKPRWYEQISCRQQLLLSLLLFMMGTDITSSEIYLCGVSSDVWYPRRGGGLTEYFCKPSSYWSLL